MADAYVVLLLAIREKSTAQSVTGFNDSPGRKHEQVTAVLREAIQLAQ